MRYIALVHKEPDSGYGVSFPDFPGCISAGDTLDEALANAIEALSGHVRLMMADGDAIPSPRSVDDLRNLKEWAAETKDAVVSAVPLIAESGSTTSIKISLDSGLLDAIDRHAKKRGQTRSAFLSTAAKHELQDS